MIPNGLQTKIIEIDKPEELNRSKITRQIEDLFSKGYLSKEIKLQLNFFTLDTDPLFNKFQVIKNRVAFNLYRRKPDKMVICNLRKGWQVLVKDTGQFWADSEGNLHRHLTPAEFDRFERVASYLTLTTVKRQTSLNL